MQLAGSLIFDFDGVLADTEPLHWCSWRSVLERYGVSLSWDEYCEFGRGVNDEQMLATLPQLAGRPQVLADIKGRMTERMEMVRDWCVDRPLITLQTVNLLKSLKSFRLGLVTSSERRAIEPLLLKAEIHSRFHSIVYGEDTERHKPDPAPYLLIRERLGMNAGTAFEDSEAGFESAKRAGFHVIRVPDPTSLPQIVGRAIGRMG